MNAMLDLVRRHQSGEHVGIYSVCSAHPLVLEAAMRLAKGTGSLTLVEATSNQVNQDGGYTGMRPPDFRERLLSIATKVDLPHDRVVLGGDHLGPNCWQGLSSQTALQKAAVMVGQYVAAGFRKIHLDCSMSCADDPRSLGDAVTAERAAALCEITEAEWRRVGGEPPVYIIGTEVPVPGGAHETLEGLAVTTPAAAHATIEVHRRAFERHGVEDAWSRVVGLVVQPGVEFDHHQVIDYVPAKAVELSRSIESVNGLVFEAHSTDYQAPAALAALVRDHFAILKVGPGVTFAMREVFWALSDIASELGLMRDASLKDITLAEMKRSPRYWKAHYTNPEQQDSDLQFSLSDRIRYYWSTPVVEAACTRLLEVLASRGIPLTLLSQYLPLQYAAIREGRLRNDPRELVLEAVEQVLRHYDRACRPAEQR
ncbi:MAG TPA: D-tagatose-bisphosphate aldolase, class II, non-catalytic subunit [Steroidobacteraceae bacterium]|nr:D-tagatose-bisphosphate aldolase, class II, non-catalytic subunit [Steroidobacteraceae bacterium]